nr:hypothetical protein [Rubinisphaera italica]
MVVLIVVILVVLGRI